MTAAVTTERLSANGEQDLAKRRAAARDAYLASLTEGRPISGAELGRRFGQSPRWGRDRVAEVRAGTTSGDDDSGEATTWEASGSNRDDHTASRDGTTTPPAEVATPAADGHGVTGGQGHAEAASPSLEAIDDHRDAEWGLSSPADAVPAVSPAARRISTLAVLAVALVAAVASYDHQRVLAELAGEGWRSWMLPLSVDGLVIAASISMLVCRRAGLRVGALTWLALLAGIGASLAANVAAAEPTVIGRLVAAWPPLAFAVAFEMAMRIRAIHHHTRHQPTSEERRGR